MGQLTNKGWTVLGVVLAIAVGTTSCVSTQDEAATVPSTTPIDEARFPLYALNDSTDLGRPESLIENYLVQECMTGQGFDYPSEVFIAPQSSQPDTHQTTLIGTYQNEWDPDHVGYRPVENDQQSMANRALTDWQQTMTTPELSAWNSALFGDEEHTYEVDGQVAGGYNSDGCLATALISMWGSFEALDQNQILLTTVFNMTAESEQRVLSDPRYMTALGSWQTCMEQDGVGFEDPESAFEFVRNEYWFPDPDDPDAFPPETADTGEVELLPLSQAEIDIATSDKNCSIESELYTVYNQVLNGYQVAYSESPEGQALILAVRESNDAALTRFKSQLERFGVASTD